MVETNFTEENLNTSLTLLALIVAVFSMYYAWRSFKFQRVASDPSGLHIIIRDIVREVPIKPGEGRWGTETHLIVGFQSRGPGVRYNVVLAGWGDVESQFIPETRPVWQSGDEILALEMNGFNSILKGQDPVYVGIIWEVPAVFFRGFKSCGYRIRLNQDDQGNIIEHMEIWSSWGQSWVMRKPDKEKVQLTRGTRFHSKGIEEQLEDQFASRVWTS